MLIELLLCVTKLGRFDRSTGRVRLWKEKEKNALAFEILQGHFPAIVGFEAEIWDLRTDLEHVCHPVGTRPSAPLEERVEIFGDPHWIASEWRPSSRV
jgi:hypothetical protein